MIRTDVSPAALPPVTAGPGPTVAAARRGRAFETLFTTQYPRLVSIASRILGDTGEAEDVAQDVFLQFHRRQDPEAAYASAWLHAAAAHSALNMIRGRKRRRGREALWAAGSTSANDPAEQVVAADTRRQVRAALARLRRRQAEVLALRHGGLTYAEVAEALGVGIGHVGTMLHRAEAALRKEIGDAPL